MDTWAWVEYFQGSPAGAQARKVIEGGQVATSILTLAELADLHERAGRPGLEERTQFIASRGPVLDVSPTAALRAGATKWAQRAKRHPMGLADAMIYETAREHGLELITGDAGFRGLPGVRLIEARR
ncbi:MAG: PIN domain-containing protein [Thermoplasmatota archaeon]